MARLPKFVTIALHGQHDQRSHGKNVKGKGKTEKREGWKQPRREGMSDKERKNQLKEK